MYGGSGIRNERVYQDDMFSKHLKRETSSVCQTKAGYQPDFPLFAFLRKMGANRSFYFYIHGSGMSGRHKPIPVKGIVCLL